MSSSRRPHSVALPLRPCHAPGEDACAAADGDAVGLPEEGLGHALRTPLTALHGALGLLGAGVVGDLPPDAHRLVSIALSNCSMLEAVVEAHLEELEQSTRCAGGRVS